MDFDFRIQLLSTIWRTRANAKRPSARGFAARSAFVLLCGNRGRPAAPQISLLIAVSTAVWSCASVTAAPDCLTASSIQVGGCT